MSSNFFYNAYFNYLKLEVVKEDSLFYTDPKTQIIGYYDMDKRIWYNAWSIYNLDTTHNDTYKKSKELLVYALNLENDLNGYSEVEKMMIKSMLCNSKIIITDIDDINDYQNSIQLQILLSVIYYLTKAKKIAHYYKNNYLFYVMQA